MSDVRIGTWAAAIEPAEACSAVTAALTSAAADAPSVPIALIRAARLLGDTDYAVVLTHDDHSVALSAGHPAYFHEVDDRHYAVTTNPGNEGAWRELPPHTLLDLDYCGPTWMPLTPPWEGLTFS